MKTSPTRRPTLTRPAPWLSAGVAAALLTLSPAHGQGDLDPRFGTGGILSYDSGLADAARGCAVQVDGKSLVVGLRGDAFSLTRHLGDGSLDPSYGVGGLAAPPELVDFFATDVAIQPDGKAVVCGEKANFGGSSLTVARFDTSGNLDSSFGLTGFVTHSIHQNGLDKPEEIAVGPGGEIVVCGRAYNSTFSEFAFVARFTGDGVLDPSFAATGQVVLPGTSPVVATGVAIQPDGKVLVSLQEGYTDLRALRLNSDGTFDSTFGTLGEVAIDSQGLGAGEVCMDIAVQLDGKILLAGVADDALAKPVFVVARLQPGGTLDPVFATGGVATIVMSTDRDLVRSMELQADGKIVVAGYTLSDVGEFIPAIARLLPDGNPDLSFRSDGRHVLAPVPGQSRLFQDVAVQPNGKILAVGTIIDPTEDSLMVRFTGRVWEDLGQALAGSHGTPTLTGTGSLIPGQPVTFTLTGAGPQATVIRLIGWSRIDVPFEGGVIVPKFDMIVDATTMGDGSLTLSTTWPDIVPENFEVYMQDWILDPLSPAGFAASNAILAVGQ